jgi:catalase
VLNDFERTCLVNNIVGHLKNAKKPIQEKMVAIFTKCEKEYGQRIAEGLKKAASSL